MKNNRQTEELEQFFDLDLPQDIKAVRFDLRHKDALPSAQVINAIFAGDWSMVSELLKQGADPRICRYSDGYTCESALYHALKAGQFRIAKELYKAGDRLDDLIVSEYDQLPAKVLEFLSLESAADRDYFTDETKTLSECIRSGCWTMIKEKLESASQEELDLSVEFIRIYLRNHNAKPYLKILTDLKKHGANIAHFRDEFLRTLEKLRKYPAALRPDENVLNEMAIIVKGMQSWKSR